MPVAKRLVGDLTTLRETMAAQADGGRVRHGSLKLEGLAVVDERHALIANDDDFGVHGSGPERRRSFLWLVELGEALSGGQGGRSLVWVMGADRIGIFKQSALLVPPGHPS